MVRRLVGPLLVVVLVLLSACAGRTSVTPAPVPSTSAPVTDLAAALDQFVTTDSGAWINTRAVLVSHRGDLVAERYYFSEAEERIDVYSVTKSVIATLVGIALAEGVLEDLDQTLGELLPRQRSVMSEQTRATTVRQLLMMSSGHSFEQVDRVDPSRPGLVETLLTMPTDLSPGAELSYNDGGPHLLSAVLREQTTMSPLDYARVKLFEPLGIETEPSTEGTLGSGGGSGRFAWLTDGDGVPGGGYGLRLTARDLVAIGELYRHGGEWQGRRLLDSGFVTDATTRHADLPVEDYGYGYLWWVTPFAGLEAYSAVGIGGQLILVVPARELVVVISAWPSAPTLEPVDQLAMVEQLVLPRLA